MLIESQPDLTVVGEAGDGGAIGAPRRSRGSPRSAPQPPRAGPTTAGRRTGSLRLVTVAARPPRRPG
ncbi:MAG TPA: hypothetical protein VM575_14860, partial [Nocardioides sp.]|nr:hypothetical protein [Nocardioides sp.]